MESPRFGGRGVHKTGGTPLAAGRDLREVVEQMLHIGAMVLSHGANVSVVDAVHSSIARSAELRSTLRAMEDRVAAKGLSYEEPLVPVLDATFAAYLGGVWRRLAHNSAYGLPTPRDWTIVTHGAERLGMSQARRYARAQDRTACR